MEIKEVFRLFVVIAIMVGGLFLLVNEPEITGNAIWDGSGTEEDPYNITDCEGLQAISTSLGSYFQLINDIDCSETTTWGCDSPCTGFLPISVFTGTLKGNNYVINGLYMNHSGDNIGLFGYIQGATIEDVGLTDVDIIGRNQVGGLVGYTFYAPFTIDNTYVTGQVTGNNNVGGLVGENKVSIINNSHSSATVTGNGRVGGLVGYNYYYAYIDNSYATGSVTGTGVIGGLVGKNKATGSGEARITNSNATGNVTGTNGQIGGLVGFNYGLSYGYATIDNSYAAGNVAGGDSDTIGGLVGFNWGRDRGHANIYNSHAAGVVSGYDSLGGLVGTNYADQYSYANIDNCYATGDVNGNIEEGDDVGGLVGKNYGHDSSVLIDTSYATGSVTGYEYVGGLVGTNRAYGNNGDGYATIDNSYATGTVTGYEYVGGLVGINRAYGYEDYAYATIDNSYATGTVTAEGGNAGGLVGMNTADGYEYGTYGYTDIDNSYATGTVTSSGNNLGGLVGYNAANDYGDSDIVNCYATGNVDGELGFSNNVGGLVGNHNGDYSSIDYSYATGNVSGSDNIGGLVGYREDSASIYDSFATGSITNNADFRGGLVGHTNDFSNMDDNYWYDHEGDDADYCIGWDDDEGDSTDCDGTIGGDAGLVEDDISYFFDVADTSAPFDSWDFDDIWDDVCDDQGYPPLQFEGVANVENCRGYGLGGGGTIPPTATAITPVTSQTVLSSSAAFVFYAMSLYNTTLNYNLTLDGIVNKTGTATNNTNTSVTVTGIANGNHTWNVTVWDSNGATTSGSNTFSVLLQVAVAPVVVPPIVNTSNTSGVIDLASRGVPASIINRTGVTGYEYVVSTNGSTPNVNLSVNVFIEAPTNVTDVADLSDTVSGFYYQISVDDETWYDNVTVVQLRIYYNISTITLPTGVLESTLRPVRYTNGTWVRLDCTALGGCTATLTDGTKLFAAGVDTTNGYVWANLSRFSTYGMGGAASSAASSTSTGGGGGRDGIDQCKDGKDNDGDGLIDYPADPGCVSREDRDEIDCYVDAVCGSGLICENNICVKKTVEEPIEEPDFEIIEEEPVVEPEVEEPIEESVEPGLVAEPEVIAETEPADEGSNFNEVAALVVVLLLLSSVGIYKWINRRK